MTDRQIVEKDIEALYLGNLGTVEFDLDLPTQGKNGSTIQWHSDNLNFMSHEGKVSRPSYGRGNREVILTATFCYGECEQSREYHVTVLEENNTIEVERIEPIRVSAAVGCVCCLPSAAAVHTTDGRTISHQITWEDGLERVYDAEGVFEVHGCLRDTCIPVAGQVEVSAQAPAPQPQWQRGSLGDTLESTTLLPGSEFYAAQERMHQYLLGTDPDHWLYNFRQAAGLDTKAAEPMSGWDSPDGLLRGHSTGHYLSALAQCWQATGDKVILEKARYMVESLAQCQKALEGKGCAKGFLSAYDETQFDLLEKYTPYPKIWAPYYTLHKILAGLVDLYCLADLKEALNLAEGVGCWLYTRLARLSHAQRVRMWSIYIAGEYGGINETLARLYELTGRQEFLQAARWFDNDRLFYPLIQRVDALNGMHANQHIPQVVGALEMYRACGEERYLDIAERFWKTVTENHSYAIGGVGESEMFHEPGNIAGLLTKSTCESCASYNMLKLTRRLHCCRPSAAYMDYYERTLFSHTLATTDRRPTGGTTYFLSMLPKARKDFDLLENSCCHGTGMESPFQYGASIYHTAPNAVYLEQFIPSELKLTDQGILLRQQVEKNAPGCLKLTVTAPAGTALYIRCPVWCSAEARVRVNGCAVSPARMNGYLVLRGPWEETSVEVEFAAEPRVEYASDRPDRFVVCYGPYVLAALTEQPDVLVMDPSTVNQLELRPDGDCVFEHPALGVTFMPLAQVDEQEYQIYLQKA